MSTNYYSRQSRSRRSQRCSTPRKPEDKTPHYFVTRADEDGIYEADLYDPDAPDPKEDFMQAFLNHMMEGLDRNRPPASYEPPPPNEVPYQTARPQYDDTGYSGFGSPTGAPFYEPSAPMHPNRRPAPPPFFVIIQVPFGGWMISSYLTRRAIIIILFVLFLIFLGVYNFPGVWELLLNLA
ncbi:MAG: hypothetical protein JW966_06320 [Anaerolineae bacterium]|nr:hypothetical protein [Anaerolineae bacterium]